MAKFAVDAVIDGTLDVYAAATRLFICSAQPANYTEASSTYALADVTIDSGDFTKANGDTSGRTPRQIEHLHDHRAAQLRRGTTDLVVPTSELEPVRDGRRGDGHPSVVTRRRHEGLGPERAPERPIHSGEPFGITH